MKLFVLLAALCGSLFALSTVRAELPETEAVEAGAAWILSQQTADGGFPGFTADSAPSPTGDAVLALDAAGIEGLGALSNGGASLADYFETAGAALVPILSEPGNAGAAGKLSLAASVAGEDPDLGVGMTGLLAATYDTATGQYGGGDLYDHLYVILALDAAGDSVNPAAIDYLLDRQTPRGSWSFFGGTGPDDGDTNTTSVVIQTLVRLGGDAAAVEAGLAYLDEVQNDDGGFPYSSPNEFGTASDVNSTALVVQAVLAAGEDPEAGTWAEKSTPVEHLLREQNKSGAFNYNAGFPGDNALATYQAVPALAGEIVGGNDVSLFEGWNQLGWAGVSQQGSEVVVDTLNAQVDGGPWDAVARYDEGLGYWLISYRDPPFDTVNTLEELEAGEDYWLYVIAEATLEYPLP